MPAETQSAVSSNDAIPFARRDGIRRRLLAWFVRHARVLPWRGDRDPYRIWISEVMLQQTQVVTVIPYFHRFLEKFPTLSKLALADEAEVLRVWEGLGYYRRARDLCRAARLLREQGQATIPDNPELVRSLPGFGRYTANAVLSQAYERRLPILEANSQRVLCRLFAIAGDPKQSAVQKQLWQLAEALLPRKSVGAFNQALMELGALICTPAKPNCHACPLQRHCQARLEDRVHEFPQRAKTIPSEAVEEVAVVIRRGAEILLAQRAGEGRWAKLWECPHQPLQPLEAHAAAAQRLLAALGIEAELVGTSTTIRHAVTRFRISMVCLEAIYREGAPNSAAYLNFAWVRPAELTEYPLSAPQRLLVSALGVRR